ncbi:hypothetical protein [Corynebacterium xerosis]|nr:hypothetical protein [Corynebacterium xerosis]
MASEPSGSTIHSAGSGFSYAMTSNQFSAQLKSCRSGHWNASRASS